VPPNLLAVARLEYGVPPRCCGLCCQLPLRFPPLTLVRLPPWMLVLRLKLLLTFTLMSLFPPQPQPQPQPPDHIAPMATPTPNESAMPPATAHPLGGGGG
jgi:hypothetical protein